MKHIIILIVILVTFQCCQEKNINQDLLGEWSSVNPGNVLHFSEDTLTFYRQDLMANKFTWTRNSSTIFYTQITNVDPEKKVDYSFTFKINNQKDTLLLKREMDSTFSNQFRKIHNKFEYLENYYNTKINLPQINEPLVSGDNNKFDILIWVGHSNDSLVARFEDWYGLENIEFYAVKRIMTTKQRNKDVFKYVLVSDKDVPQKDLDSIKDILKSTWIKKVFRVYKNDGIDYTSKNWKEEIEWFGRYE